MSVLVMMGDKCFEQFSRQVSEHQEFGQEPTPLSHSEH